ncbi:SAM-dependent methyltransferase, partial [Mycobacterium sp. ITM-2017-0098]
RLDQAWLEAAPGLDAKERVRRAMAAIHGVDINPFAVAIARFRLTVAGLKATGERSLVGVPAMGFRLAIGDSLLGVRGGLDQTFDFDDEGAAGFIYDTEDLNEYFGILQPGQYHVVVGNPPYITPKDKALNALYRINYETAVRQYALSVPFMELLFRLAIRGEQGQGAGYVGQITSNSFMKREFGRKLIEYLFAGHDIGNPVDLTAVIDSSGAYIPGHGTPTVIILGRRRRPIGDQVRAVLGLRGEPGQPANPQKGLVWTEIVEHLDAPGYEGRYISVADVDRDIFKRHPWSLSGGGAAALFDQISTAPGRLEHRIQLAGRYIHTGADDPYFGPPGAWRRRGVADERIRQLVEGDTIRDWGSVPVTETLFPYGNNLKACLDDDAMAHHLWIFRVLLSTRREPGGTHEEIGLTWYEFSRWHP